MIEKLYISTIADDAEGVAREYGLGLEIAEFCTAYNMDSNFGTWDARARAKLSGVTRAILHAPFNELCPGAIDPLVVEVAKKRYAQAHTVMRGYGITAMIAHSGFIPMVYHESWFVEKSVEFWTEFLSDKPEDFKLYLENVLESSPQMLCEIIKGVNDPRFKLCIDFGHAAIMGEGITPAEWLEQCLPLIGHIHMHNNFGKRDTHSALDNGSIDFAPLIRKVTEVVPSATFTLEVAGSGRASVGWLIAHGFLERRSSK